MKTLIVIPGPGERLPLQYPELAKGWSVCGGIGSLKMFFLLIFLVVLINISPLMCGHNTLSNHIEALECPVPDNVQPVPKEKCLQFSACIWSDDNQICSMSSNSVAGYKYKTDPIVTDRGFQVNLEKNNLNATLYDGDIEELTLNVLYHEDHHVQIKIVDANKERYEVPLAVNLPSQSGTDPKLKVNKQQQGQDFELQITRLATGSNVLNSIGPVSYEDQFLQISFKLSSSQIYGLGEHTHTILQRKFLPRATYPVFARDQAVGETETNHYGVFPYYVNVEDDAGNTHSVYFMNSNAMEFTTFQLEDGSPAITFRTIGGILDIHVFAGPTPEEVNQQFISFIGRPHLPPYWALGFHLSRYGYGSTEEVRKVRDRMRAAKIPQDMQTFDIDYMDARKDFTFDPVNFGDLPELINELKSENVRATVILDPAVVANYTSYDPYIRGRNVSAFIRWMSADLIPDDQQQDTDDFMLGYVWPDEKVVFPDFLNPSAKLWWSNEISLFRNELAFDALWIDMNEPSNFGTNQARPWNWPFGKEDWSLKCPYNKLDSPPYPTKATNGDFNECKRISDKTLCMSGLQTNGVRNFTHYDVHSLFGYSETVATFEALKNLKPDSRPLVLSRSTFPGSGKYVAHWLGDNHSSWQELRNSIIGLIEFNIFGIPMVGADICGFGGVPSMELCARWMQVGAFYPFSRNHNALYMPDQDPAVWPEVAAISRDVLLMRYRYLPYLYLLFHNAHISGSTVIRPLFNVFPNDTTVRDNADQFFWGDAVMIAPVIYKGETSRLVYFPEGRWFDLETGVEEAIGPISKNINAPLEKIPVYLRAGRIIPFQEPEVTTDKSRLNDFGLLVSLDDNKFAAGEVFWDDGEKDYNMNETYLSSVIFSKDEMVMTNRFSDEAAAGVNLATIRVIGFPKQPVGISVNGNDLTTFTYDAATQVMVMTVNVPLMNDLKILLNYQNPTLH